MAHEMAHHGWLLQDWQQYASARPTWGRTQHSWYHGSLAGGSWNTSLAPEPAFWGEPSQTAWQWATPEEESMMLPASGDVYVDSHRKNDAYDFVLLPRTANPRPGMKVLDETNGESWKTVPLATSPPPSPPSMEQVLVLESALEHAVLVEQSQQLCRYGPQCFSKNCRFAHPERGAGGVADGSLSASTTGSSAKGSPASSPPPSPPLSPRTPPREDPLRRQARIQEACRYGAQCRNNSCRFLH